MAFVGTPTHIRLDFRHLGLVLRAKLLWEVNPDLCRTFAATLPFTTVYSHTTGSGQGMYAPTRVVGRVPARHELLTRLPHGTLTLSTDNYKTLGFFYGTITEPLPGFPPVAEVVEEDKPLMAQVGREVWLANTITHDPAPATVTVSGEGGEDA